MDPQSFRLDRKSSFRLHKHQEKIIRLKQSRMSQYFSKAPSDKDSVNDISKCESTPMKAELSACLMQGQDIGMFDNNYIIICLFVCICFVTTNYCILLKFIIKNRI